MIRFSAALVVLALGVLAAGAATSRLLLVYVAIGGSALALVCLGLGVVLKRGELFGGSSRGTGVSDQGRLLAGFGADGFSPADRAPAFTEQPRGARSSAPGHRGQHASGQSGPSPEDRVRVPAGPGRPPADRTEPDWQEPPRDSRSRGRRGEPQGQRVGPQREADAAAEMRATDPRTADARGSDVRPSGTWQPDARGAGAPDWTSPSPWQARPPVPPASGMPPGRPQWPAQFPGESPAATPPFGSQGPDATRPRHDAPGPSRPEPARGEPPRPQGPAQQPSRPQAPRPEQPAAFRGSAARPPASRSDGIPPAVEPIYPAGKAPAAPGGERQEKAPEPAESQGWFYRAQDSEEPAAQSSPDEKPRAAAAEAKPASTPAATGSAAEARTAGSGAPGTAAAPSGTGEAGGKPQGGKQDLADGGKAGAVPPVNLDGAPPDREVTIVPGVPRYHRPGCSTIRFMDESDLEKRTLISAVEAGCAPCEACQAGAADPAPGG